VEVWQTSNKSSEAAAGRQRHWLCAGDRRRPQAPGGLAAGLTSTDSRCQSTIQNQRRPHVQKTPAPARRTPLRPTPVQQEQAVRSDSCTTVMSFMFAKSQYFPISN
jgi:hypothetical protein